MGGYSSGGHNTIKGYYEGTYRIDIKHLQRIGMLKTEASKYNYRWNSNGVDSGSAEVCYIKSHNIIFIKYTLTDNQTGEKKHCEDKVYIENLKVKYGDRAYLKCSCCGNITTVVCFRWSRWGCRKCQKLNYGSSQSNSLDYGERYRRQANKILKRLKFSEGWSCSLYYVPKPKRMRYKTYVSLLSEFRKYQELRESWFNGECKRRFPSFRGP